MSSLKSYLAKLEACLGGLPLDAQQAVMEELRGHLEDRAAALRVKGLEKEASMSEAIERFGEAREVGVALRDVHGPSSWGEALAGMMPFLIIGLATIIIEWPRTVIPLSMWLGIGLFLGWYLVLMIGFGVGWMKGLPRWSYSYAGYVLIFTLYMMRQPTPRLKIFNYTFQHDELMEWRAWIPFLVIVVIALLLTRSLRPLSQLATDIWKDWTRLSFGLYSMLPFAVAIAFDEVDNSYQLPYMLLLTLILVEGAFAYMRSNRVWQRALALLVGTLLVVVVTTVGTIVYWLGPGEGWMNVELTVIRGGYVVAVVFAPALLGVLRRSMKVLQVA